MSSTSSGRISAASDLARIYWYSLVDYPNQQPGFRQRGLVRSDRSAKPALAALPYVIQATDGPPEALSTDGIRAFAFGALGSPGTHVVAWARDSSAQLALPAAGHSRAEVTELAVSSLVEGTCCPQRTVATDGERFVLDIGTATGIISLGGP